MQIQRIPWLLAVLLLAAFGVTAYVGWPGEFTGAGTRFCERFRAGWIGQPANTWSNLGFVGAGLWMAARIGDGLGAPFAGRNLFTRSARLPILYASLVVFLGPGSMAMHASGRAWGGTVDVLSMLLYIAFPLAYAAVRAAGAVERAFWPLYLALALGLGLPRALGVLPWSGSAVYTVLIPAFIGLEAIAQWRRPEVERDRRWLGLAAASFLTALVIWRLSHTGAPLCDPRSWIQGHAVWHLLCAVSTLGIFLFYLSEDDPGTADARS